MVALVDCNNFYVSCERLFQPSLQGKPVIVLSNNDGCAIARSEEAKAIGINMGTPAFMVRDQLKQHNVKIFSSNYTLYDSISKRVMTLISEFVEQLEIYSIDEAFLDMSNMDKIGIISICEKMRKKVKEHIGIPVSIGVAKTKTLAKIANKYAKKKFPSYGIYAAITDEQVREMLAATDIEGIWGIGKQYSLLLNKNGFNNALQLLEIPEAWMRNNMTVQGQRLLNEIKGIPAKQWEFENEIKKNICTSRSFGDLLTDKDLIREALSNYAANCALKLRQQGSAARSMIVFLQTNPHRSDQKQYFRSINIRFDFAANDTPTILAYALKAFEIIYRQGFYYLKCGVIVQNLVGENDIQFNLFSEKNNLKSGKAIKAMDELNNKRGRDLVRFARQGFEKKYRLRADHLSQRYTTRISEVLKINI